MDNCFGSVKSGQRVKDCPNLKGQYKRSKQESGSNVDHPKKNYFYALRFRGKQESSPDVVTGILQVFSINVYNLLETGATLSFVTPLVASEFYSLLYILNEPFIMSTRWVSRLLQRGYIEIFL